jgi:CheY-like chemotaxis protein
MSTFDEFEAGLRDALTHLYDPAYRPPEILWAVTGCDPHQGLDAIQMAMIRAIEDLKPAPHVPSTARSRRVYGLLLHRYVQGLTQEETAERLGITPRHLRREQPGAVHALALHMWEQGRVAEELAQETAGRPSDAQLPEYRFQVKQELASLQESAPGAVADVGEAIRGAVKLGGVLTSKRDVDLEMEMERVQPNLVAAIHPAALRQVLLTAIRQLAQRMASGQIALHAERQEGNVRIAITGQPVTTDEPPNANFIREIVAAEGGSVEIRTEDDRISLYMELPSADLAVLVVDDNADLIHLYRRYVASTRYRIVHTAQGQRAFEIVEASAPDVIILDVMLPDIDGWELLAHLHEHPATRAIPVVVCSVVREEDLALALGAALYLPKPVERQQFIQALDHVLSQAAAGAPIAQANNAAAW